MRHSNISPNIDMAYAHQMVLIDRQVARAWDPDNTDLKPSSYIQEAIAAQDT